MSLLPPPAYEPVDAFVIALRRGDGRLRWALARPSELPPGVRSALRRHVPGAPLPACFGSWRASPSLLLLSPRPDYLDRPTHYVFVSGSVAGAPPPGTDSRVAGPRLPLGFLDEALGGASGPDRRLLTDSSVVDVPWERVLVTDGVAAWTASGTPDSLAALWDAKRAGELSEPARGLLTPLDGPLTARLIGEYTVCLIVDRGGSPQPPLSWAARLAAAEAAWAAPANDARRTALAQRAAARAAAWGEVVDTWGSAAPRSVAPNAFASFKAGMAAAGHLIENSIT